VVGVTAAEVVPESVVAESKVCVGVTEGVSVDGSEDGEEASEVGTGLGLAEEPWKKSGEYANAQRNEERNKGELGTKTRRDGTRGGGVLVAMSTEPSGTNGENGDDERDAVTYLLAGPGPQGRWPGGFGGCSGRS
jgi:hypothetical protein